MRLELQPRYSVPPRGEGVTAVLEATIAGRGREACAAPCGESLLVNMW